MTKGSVCLWKLTRRCQQGAFSGTMKKDMAPDDSGSPPLVKTTSLYIGRKEVVFLEVVGEGRHAIKLG